MKLGAILLGIGLLSVSGVVSDASAKPKAPLYVSILDVLVRPQKLPTDYIAVLGYFRNSGPGAYLYLTKAHALAADVPSSILLVVKDAKDMKGDINTCADRYVRVIGRYDHKTFHNVPVLWVERILIPSQHDLLGGKECFSDVKN